MVGLGPDRRRVDDHFRAAQRVRAGDLGEPLVPTRRERERGAGHRNDGISAVTGLEVAILVVARRHRQVRLAGAR